MDHSFSCDLPTSCAIIRYRTIFFADPEKKIEVGLHRRTGVISLVISIHITMFCLTYLALVAALVSILSAHRRAILARPHYQTLDNYEFLHLMPAGVHQLNWRGNPIKPAYMILQPDGQPLFYDLNTNRTIGDIFAYTGFKGIKLAEHAVHLTGGVFKSWSLLDLRGYKPILPPLGPFGRRMYQKKNETWWLRAKQNYRALR